MEDSDYLALNSETIIFIWRKDNDFILRGILADDNSRGFEFTGGGSTESLLGKQIKQPREVIHLQVDTLFREHLPEYMNLTKRLLGPRKI